MTSRPPSEPHSISRTARSRARGDLPSGRSRLPRHQGRFGRIQRTRSTSSSFLSTRNQEAIWETATGRSWTHDDQILNPEESLLDIIPSSPSGVTHVNIAASPALSVAPHQTLSSWEREQRLVESKSVASDAEANTEILRSMEFMMPPEYRSFASHSSGYQAVYSGAEHERGSIYASSQPSSYASSYTARPAPPALPALPTRAAPTEGETAHRFTGSGRNPFRTATTSAPTSYTGTLTSPHTAPTGASFYSNATDAYSYAGYGQGHATSPGYPSPSQTSGFAPVHQTPYGASSYDQGSGSEDPAAVRVVNPRPNYQCWEHGCNGRSFSTFSNLLRHQREKSGVAQKSSCPNCGAVFTRSTARNGHVAHGKCKSKSRGSTSDAE